MRQGTCSECGLKGSLQTYFWHRDRVYCDSCTAKLAEPGAGKFHGLEPPSAIIDPTICAGCKTDAAGKRGTLSTRWGAPIPAVRIRPRVAAMHCML